MKIRVEQQVDATPEQVFEVFTDFETYLKSWTRGVLAVRRVSPGPTDVGSTFEIRGRNVGMRGDVKWLYEVTEYQPPFRFSGRAQGGPIPFEETFELSASPQGTKLVLHQELKPQARFRLFSPLLSTAWSRLIAQNLRRLATIVEKST